MIGRQLDLIWIVSAAEGSSAEASAPEPLPEAAAPFLANLRRYIKLGHVRAIETVLTELEAEIPECGPAVAAMRRHLDNFDLRALSRTIDHVG